MNDARTNDLHTQPFQRAAIQPAERLGEHQGADLSNEVIQRLNAMK
jgi:hypothetical protein